MQVSTQPTTKTKTNRSAADTLMNQLSTRMANPTTMWGVAPWGIPTLDKITGGIQPHTLTILGARPMVGKSALAGQIALNVARYFKDNHIPLWVKVILFEMTAEVFLRRIACSMAVVSSMKVMSGNLTDQQAERYMQALSEIQDLPIAYTDEQASFKEVSTFLQHKDQPTGFWILDHVGLFMDVKTQGQNQTGAMVQALNAVQHMAYKIAPGLAIAHMNRGSESNQDKRPTLSNYSGTDQVGKNADLALALHRPWLYMDIPEEQRNEPQPAELLVLKNREGPLWNVNMIFNPRLAQYIEAPGANEGAGQ